jgi:hypothetical protein
MEKKKIIMESGGKSEEISKDKLEEMKKSPDFQVKTVKENEDETRVNVKQRLYD